MTKKSAEDPTLIECERLRRMLDFSSEMICVHDEEGILRMVSASVKRIIGYEPDNIIGKSYKQFIHPDDLKKTESLLLQIKRNKKESPLSIRYRKANGTLAYLDCIIHWEEADKMFYAVARDVSQIVKGKKALKKSEENYKTLFYSYPSPTWIHDAATFTFLDANQAAFNTYGYTREEFVGMSVKQIFLNNEFENFKQQLNGQNDFPKNLQKQVWAQKKKNGEILFAEISFVNLNLFNSKTILVQVVDRTQQVKAETELKKTTDKYLFLSEAANEGVWDWDLKTGKIVWNEGIKRMFGILSAHEISNVNWWTENIHEDDKKRVHQKLQHYITQKLPGWNDEYRFKASDGSYKHIHDRGYFVYDEHNEPSRMIGIMQNMTERKANESMLQRLNASLEKRAKELAVSNNELEKFAYVASHDLQEPLRMVTSFLQLLEKKHKAQLDHKAQEYISYAVDGAERMKKLIQDLLQYSRVNNVRIEKEDVDLNKIVKDVELVFQSQLIESGGIMESEKLPVVKANPVQMMQLFQNLIGNAIKYKSEKQPLIRISYTEDEAYFNFAIADNGIGIATKFFEKIFVIFQRLHHRDKYAGTGIGLAICKRIVEKHGGKIWLISTEEKGSTFYFTLPKS